MERRRRRFVRMEMVWRNPLQTTVCDGQKRIWVGAASMVRA